MSVAYGTGGAWTGRRTVADRETEIHPERYQGPVPDCLLPSGMRRARKLEPDPAPAEKSALAAPSYMVKHSGGTPENCPEMEAARDGAVDKVEESPGSAASTKAEAPHNPACRSCGSPTVGKGKDPNGKQRLRCRSCGKTQLAEESRPRDETPGLPCPRCGGPSVRWGKAATGSPVRRCTSPECGRSWTVEKAPPRARGKRSPATSEALRKTWAGRTPAERTAIGRKAAARRLAKQPHSARSAGSKKTQAALGPEARRARAQKAARACHSLPEDRKRAMIEKRMATCAARRARLKAMDGELVYLAAPYSHPDPAVREQRFQAINRAAGDLMAAGTHVFSPISHTHPIAEAHALPGEWAFWEAYDRAMLSRCSRVIVLQLEGWEASVGVAAELEIAREMGLKVEFLLGDVQ